MNFSGRMQDFKQRGVFRVGAVYLAAGFALIQAADLIFPRLGLPDWTVTAVIIVALLGFPVALALAWAFDIHKTDSGDVATADSLAAPHTARTPIVAILLVTLPLAALGAWYAMKRGDTRDVDADLVAVLPFRIAGASADLSYLREGMVDLLAAKLGGTEGVRAVDSRTVLAAWRGAVANDKEDVAVDDAIPIGRSVRAGHLLLGEIVGTERNLVLNAQLVDVRTKRVTRATVEGAADSLPRMVDRLAAQLLALNSGEDSGRLEVLMSTSLPATRKYLEGRQLYRRGQYNKAIAKYREALQLDSTFALAGFGMARAGGWVLNAAIQDGARVVLNHRDRLPPRDLAVFQSQIGPRFPVPISGRDALAASERAIQVAPDNPEAWYAYGDVFFHWGRVIGAEDPYKRAAEAFGRAVKLDSSFAAPMEHLVEIAAMNHDSASVRRLADLYLSRDSVGETADLIRWFRAAVTDDEVALRGIWERLDSMDVLTIDWIAGISQERQIRMQDVSFYEPHLDKRGEVPAIAHFLNAGQRSVAMRNRELNALKPRGRALGHIRTVLYAGGDSAEIPAYMKLLEPSVNQPLPTDSAKRRAAVQDICAVEEWRTWNGDLRSVDRSLAALQSARSDPEFTTADIADACFIVIDAIAAVVGNRPHADAALQRLEQASLEGRFSAILRNQGNLVLARLLEMRGDDKRALEAVRRRSRVGLNSVTLLSTYRRLEGRLAAKTGDLDGARRAYSHYLAMRPNPEPYARPEVEAVRRELEALGTDR